MNEFTSSSATSNTPLGSQRTVRLLLHDALDRSAQDWTISSRTALVIAGLPVFVVFAAVVSGLLGKQTYKWFTGEDGLAETLQALLYGTSCVLSAIMVRRHFGADRKLLAGLYVMLLCGLFFLTGEELSWGQRLFGWNTPEQLASINKQAETNLHNIYGVGDAFKWIQLVVGAYGVLLPLAVYSSDRLARYREFLSAITPHFLLLLYFLPMLIWRLYRNLFEAPDSLYFAISEFNEVIELILSMGFFLFLIYQLRHWKPESTAPRD